MVNLLRHRFGVLEKIGVIKMSFNDRRNDMLITIFMDEHTLDADLIDKGHDW